MNHDILISYIAEVLSRLPESDWEEVQKQMIKTFEPLVGEDSQPDDVKKAIMTMGPPFVVASSYIQRKRAILNPVLMVSYQTTLKTVMILFSVIALVIAIYEGFMSASLASLGQALWGVFAKGLTHIIAASLLSFGLVTLTYMLIGAIENNTAIKTWNANIYERPYHLYPDVNRSLILLRINSVIGLGGGLLILMLTKARTLGWYDQGKMVARLMNPDVIGPYIPLLMLALFLSVIPDAMRIAIGHTTNRIALYDTLMSVISLVIVLIFMHQAEWINSQFLAYVAQFREVHISVVIRSFGIWVWVISLIAVALTIWRIIPALKTLSKYKKRQA